MLSFSEFDFKWFVHIIDAYNPITCYLYLENFWIIPFDVLSLNEVNN